ncbi:MAG: C_GCAxxG_C_C family protein [Bacteroidales bacterium]|nr:C_GCAxxG_C_C family protein [Bacteroidales bacterium]
MKNQTKIREEKQQLSVEHFKTGRNCAQSVLSVYADDFHLEKQVLLGLSSGFGAGMGRLQETCGAVTGAYMVLGLYNGSIHSNNGLLKEASYEMIQKFTTQFKEEFGTTKCKLLLDCDLNTDEGQIQFEEEKLGELICQKCISTSVKLIESLINQ